MPDVQDDDPRDITFRSTIHADRLRFTAPPRTAVRFPGSGERTSLSRSDRTNLPHTVEPDEDYRDVTVHYRLETGVREFREPASD